MEYTTIIGIYGIFFALMSASFIKNLYFNANSFSRAIRLHSFSIYLFYVLSTIFGIIFLIKYKDSGISLHNNLNLASYVLLSLLATGSMLSMDEKRISIRDGWKYQAQVFENFKNSRQNKWRIFGIFQEVLKWIVLLLTIAILIWMLVVSHELGTQKWVIPFACISIFHLVFNYCILMYPRSKLINLNTRYNYLREIILNKKDLNKGTKKEVSKKALEIYNKIFTDSIFYKKNVATNNAIIVEIGLYGGIEIEEIIKYSRNPLQYNNLLTMEEFEARYPKYKNEK
ncbi:hypothetical protein MYMA111404_03725 [Mycoplasma marinum]|uniref:Uncharacterized protein n=1 Tax=Mycoplasma marinum TaxID=1937190 RepID=A0A4R0XTA4_9MOLU|nr:hypothetical protein [Mycoplasma marinum]TCG10977.1 hypothetical protein C4B24_03380 [Mycoplasma marinum]